MSTEAWKDRLNKEEARVEELYEARRWLEESDTDKEVENSTYAKEIREAGRMWNGSIKRNKRVKKRTGGGK